MSYPTLIGEMAKNKITIESMAQFLGLHRNTVLEFSIFVQSLNPQN